MNPLGSHIAFDAADLMLHRWALNLPCVCIVRSWVQIGLEHSERVQVTGVRLVQKYEQVAAA